MRAKPRGVATRRAIEVPRPTQAQRDRAQRILAHEARGDKSPKGLAAAAERVCQRLGHHAGKAIGADAFDALFTRTLTLVRQDFPFLGTVSVKPQAHLKGLGESVQEQPVRQAADAIVAVVATFLALLTDVIGEELSLALLVEVWAGSSLDEVSNCGQAEI